MGACRTRHLGELHAASADSIDPQQLHDAIVVGTIPRDICAAIVAGAVPRDLRAANAAALIHDPSGSGVTSHQAAVHSSAGSPAELPHGHRVDNRTRVCDFGVVTTLIPPPSKGTMPFQSIQSAPPFVPGVCPPPAPSRPWETGVQGSSSGNHIGKLPKLNFPMFDGENPKSWLKNCEDYFDLYSIETPIWIKVTTMHF